jgi:NADPH:quinone reductase-like Zn-dependent oxidoreductase
MKAARIHGFGGSDQVVLDELPLPAPGAGELLIKIVASGVNPIDLKVRRGELAAMLSGALPMTLGWELAGTVAKVGSGVTGFREGDAVFAKLDLMQAGAHAEAVLVPAAQTAPKPQRLSFEAAAVVPATAIAAEAVIDAALVKAGERVLVQGAGGAVGHWLLQLLKPLGAEILATASARDLDRVRQLGADQALDYRRTDLASAIGRVDVVIDLVGGEVQARAWNLLGADGRFITLVPPDAVPEGRTPQFIFSASDGAVLARIGAMIEDGALAPLPVAAVRPLAEIGLVHEEVEAGRLKGKIALVP